MSKRKNPEVQYNNHTWHKTGKKYCFGPLHDIHGELLPCLPDSPLSAFSFFRTGQRAGKPFSRCKKCNHLYRHGTSEGHGYQSATAFMYYYNNCTERIGKAETNRRVGISWNFVRRMQANKQKYVKMDALARVQEVWEKIERYNEKRHPNDIHHGTTARGKKEQRRRYRHLAPLREINYRKLYPVKSSVGDPYWWITGDNGEFARWGDEMLGSDF